MWRSFEGAPTDPINAQGARDIGPIPPGDDETIFLPAVGVPWGDVQENPEADGPALYTNDPSLPFPNVGELPLVGAYEGAFATKGPVVDWGFEPSGGLLGDQQTGRVMRFETPVPDRYDPNGVQDGSWADSLAARLAYGDGGYVSDAEYTTSLIDSV
jgi:hypothetical protein